MSAFIISRWLGDSTCTTDSSESSFHGYFRYMNPHQIHYLQFLLVFPISVETPSIRSTNTSLLELSLRHYCLHILRIS
ncbi:hypothetical protein TcWFU_004298 [Taenia crassiceps]|uniref:Uncharacterized protein n=1 Tax=Taenia crassiceps TaxID=6207 RepID=A0ABR4QQU3_9CEST